MDEKRRKMEFETGLIVQVTCCLMGKQKPFITEPNQEEFVRQSCTYVRCERAATIMVQHLVMKQEKKYSIYDGRFDSDDEWAGLEDVF